LCKNVTQTEILQSGVCGIAIAIVVDVLSIQNVVALTILVVGHASTGPPARLHVDKKMKEVAVVVPTEVAEAGEVFPAILPHV
jgi:L-cysteine desulfidase